MKPNDLPLPFIEHITNNFSEKRKVGSGGFGDVYKGVDRNGKEIAVKKLNHMTGLDGQQFRNEFSNLTRVQHQNIVRLVGYCDEVRLRPVNINGEYIFAKMIYRVLCFEYLPEGNLYTHLSEESPGFDWPTCYKIIKGICEGLNYLHWGLKESIFHLDLKPANILLDKNMVPKIADFGISRLFHGTHTHTTINCIGTEYYMPPEYILKRQISNKYDIFSLGIIMIQIMAGRKGYHKYGNMTSDQEFIMLVHANWRERIGTTSKYAEQDCKQVKTCIEIAVRCVQAERDNRPAIRDIIRELKKTETNATALWRNQAKVTKIGQWGGLGGGHVDIEVAPHRLESLVIGSGEVIYSLEFTYSDYRGQQHTAGPWGGFGPHKGGYPHKIQLSRSEYIKEASGTIGPFDRAPAGVITSLTFITTAASYGPFGEVRGTPFQVPVRNNGSIVGFFARAGWYLDAFGLYVNPKQETEKQEDEEAQLIKIGPWGGNGGSPCDTELAPSRLESVTIRSGIVIDSLEFSYSDQDGQKHTAGPWGGSGGSAFTIQLGSSEFLTGVYGTTGLFTNSAADVVTSLTLVTNARSYGPFGQGRGIPFEIPIQGNGSILGFFGRADSYVDAIGVYVNPEQESMEQKTGLTKIGPCGGTEGTIHFIDDRPEPHRLDSMTIRYDTVINSLMFSYSEHNGKTHTVGPWGGPGEKGSLIRLEPLQFIHGISGTFGPFGTTPNVITSLTVVTNHGAYGPFGQGGGTHFSIPAGRDGCVVGFFARAGLYLEALGAYVHTY